MIISYESLQQLMQQLEYSVDKLLDKIANQQQEIDQLKEKNKQLEDCTKQTLQQIEQYVVELEQIKDFYANNYHNIKQ